MRPLTYACPKELLPVGALPVIHRLMDELAGAGIEEVCVVTSAEKRSLEEYFARQGLSLRLSFVNQREPLGLGDALLYGREFAGGETVLIALGDSLIDSGEAVPPLARMVGLHTATGAGVVLGETVPDDRISRYGVVDPADPAVASLEETFLLKGIVEKPPVDRAPSRVAASARYLLPPAIFDALKAVRKGSNEELGLIEGLAALIREGEPLYGLKLRAGERRWDIGGFKTYFDAFAAYAARDRAALGEGES